MPTLLQSLHGHDLGHLRIIAEHWGVELNAPNARTGLAELNKAILDPSLVTEISAALSLDAQSALRLLLSSDGRLPWPQFTRSYGDLRPIGPGRRDRERPDRSPISPVEELWYRAFIARAFFDTSAGAQEFAYIPDDLLPLLTAALNTDQKTGIHPGKPLLGRAARSEERAHPLLADDHLLDHICTLLAAYRLDIDPTPQFSTSPDHQVGDSPDPLLSFATSLLTTANLLSPSGLPDPENARLHLESPRYAALSQLTQAWLQSPDHNDLHHVPHLKPEGEWHNDPLDTRRFVVDLLSVIPGETWWSISAFLADLRRDFPDFQRPASDYDSWFIRDTRTGEFLRGFEHWEDVDGALIRYLITGPLHWLGILDLALSEESQPVWEASAFRRSKWSSLLLCWTGETDVSSAQDFHPEDAPIHVRSDGRVNIPFLTPRAARYQIARFCQWETPSQHEYRYRLTPGSLDKAIDQGLKIQHLQTLLARHTKTVPPNIVNALNRWEQRGTEARLQSVLILRLSSPELLGALQKSRAARYLGDPLGPTTVVIKPG
ncbi:MAG: helicase-associated domain-containing protein, partial [Anaerolineales bacterium]